jgi:hypothetical protein
MDLPALVFTGTLLRGVWLTSERARTRHARRAIAAEERDLFSDGVTYDTFYRHSGLDRTQVEQALRVLSIALDVPFGFLRPSDPLDAICPGTSFSHALLRQTKWALLRGARLRLSPTVDDYIHSYGRLPWPSSDPPRHGVARMVLERGDSGLLEALRVLATRGLLSETQVVRQLREVTGLASADVARAALRLLASELGVPIGLLRPHDEVDRDDAEWVVALAVRELGKLGERRDPQADAYVEHQRRERQRERRVGGTVAEIAASVGASLPE